MGGNGTFSKGHVLTEEQRQWRTLDTIPASDGFPEVVVVEMKNKKYSKTPEESSTSNRVYAVFYPNGSNLKEISMYTNHMKTSVIHTEDHHGISPHYHNWSNGKQEKAAHHLTNYMKGLLKHVRDYKK